MNLNFKRIVYHTIFILVIIVGFTNIAYSQLGPCGPFDTPGVDCDADNNPDIPVPLDGGAGILIAAGVAYGIKKYRNQQKKSNQIRID